MQLESTYAWLLMIFTSETLSQYKGYDNMNEVVFRRSVSNTYYAAFNLIAEHAPRLLFRTPTSSLIATRSFAHGEIYTGFQSLIRELENPNHQHNRLNQLFSQEAFPLVVRLGKLFNNLQNKRHAADYDHSVKFSYAESKIIVSQGMSLLYLFDKLYNDYPDDLANLISVLLFKKSSHALKGPRS